MKFRRRRMKTALLSRLVHPVPLLEALKTLQDQGDIEWFEYGHYNCIIKLTKHSGLAMMIDEASQPVANPRPFIKNKNSEQTPIRKTKRKVE